MTDLNKGNGYISVNRADALKKNWALIQRITRPKSMPEYTEDEISDTLRAIERLKKIYSECSDEEITKAVNRSIAMYEPIKEPPVDNLNWKDLLVIIITTPIAIVAEFVKKLFKLDK